MSDLRSPQHGRQEKNCWSGPVQGGNSIQHGGSRYFGTRDPCHPDKSEVHLGHERPFHQDRGCGTLGVNRLGGGSLRDSRELGAEVRVPN